MGDNHIKKMADFLHNGATMLDKNCPRCDTILFRLKNKTIFCTKCEQEVVIVKSREEELEWTRKKANSIKNNVSPTFSDLNNLFASLIKKLSQQLNNIENMTALGKVLENIDSALSIMQKLRKMENNSI